MTQHPTSRIEHDFNIVWIKNNPRLAIESAVKSVLEAIDLGLTDIKVQDAYMPGMSISIVAQEPPPPPKETVLGRTLVSGNLAVGTDVTIVQEIETGKLYVRPTEVSR